MTGASPEPLKPSHHPRDQALLSAGIVVWAVLLVYDRATRPLRVARFVEPITVEAVVVDAQIHRVGGGRACQPMFRYEVNGQSWTTQLPTANPQSCYTDGRTVLLIVDAAHPQYIADAASERYARQTQDSGLALGSILLGLGGWLRWRNHRHPS